MKVTTDDLAQVIQINGQRPRSCFICVHAMVTPDKTYCSLFTEWIDQESRVAADCDAYQDDQAKG